MPARHLRVVTRTKAMDNFMAFRKCNSAPHKAATTYINSLQDNC